MSILVKILLKRKKKSTFPRVRYITKQHVPSLDQTFISMNVIYDGGRWPKGS